MKTYNIKNLLLIFIILIIIILIINTLFKNNDLFENPENKINKPIERTKLYVSLFLNNLDEVVNNLSNPDIKYESKNIDLNKYSDILL